MPIMKEAMGKPKGLMNKEDEGEGGERVMVAATAVNRNITFCSCRFSQLTNIPGKVWGQK